MTAPSVYAAVRVLVPRRARPALPIAAALVVFLVWGTALMRQPVIALDRAAGLYQVEQGDSQFRWTSSQATFPLTPFSGPTQLDVHMSYPNWPGKPADTTITLETDTGMQTVANITAAQRHLQLLLPPGTSVLRLHTPVWRAPGGDWRWLGVQVLDVSATPSGLPLRALAQSLLAALVSVPLVLGAAWLVRRGYGTVLAISLLGLGLRLLWLADSPPLMHRDEIVSMVDAWHLAQTGRDHLGHVLPIASFEAYGDWISPLLTYVLLPWVAIFGPQPIIARLVVAVVGALAIPAIYGLGRELRLPVAAAWAALVAALSPWQIFLSRVAIPPALVATTLTLFLWAALRFVRRAGRRDALALALAAGIAIYAYPTLKMVVPLLLACTLLLALVRHRWNAARRWLPAALLLALLWLPFTLDTLFNPLSGSRLQLIALKSTSADAWLTTWWHNYRIYFGPRLYYGTGGIRKIIQGLPNQGLALGIERVLLAGLIMLPVLLARRRTATSGTPATATLSGYAVVLLAAAVLIAPLPASLTNGNPSTFRAAPVAPLYALLVGIGAAAWWEVLGWLPTRAQVPTRSLAALLIALALAAESGAWFAMLVQQYPTAASQTWFYADGELETMQRVASAAPQFDEVWMDTRSIGRPYIFLLAARPMPAAAAQAQLVVQRHPPEINAVTQLGRYHFLDFPTAHVPTDLPVIEAVPTGIGGPGYILQTWQRGSMRTLVVRGMLIDDAPDDSSVDDAPDGPQP